VNVSEVFIRRPIATSLLMAAIALFGVIAYRRCEQQRRRRSTAARAGRVPPLEWVPRQARSHCLERQNRLVQDDLAQIGVWRLALTTGY
jgi:hypothetical protein